jgi:hypothetical protein
MTTLYPKARDAFRRVNAPADEIHAQLFRDLFDSIVAVEAELGIEPSGVAGSLYGRLFGSELVSKANGYWRKISAKEVPTTDGNLRGTFEFAAFHQWQTGMMDGTSTNMGDGTPFVFALYQGRGVGSSFFDSTGRVFGQPWTVYPFIVQKDRAYLAGVSTDNASPNNGGQPVRIGVIAWGMQPSKTRQFEET